MTGKLRRWHACIGTPNNDVPVGSWVWYRHPYGHAPYKKYLETLDSLPADGLWCLAFSSDVYPPPLVDVLDGDDGSERDEPQLADDILDSPRMDGTTWICPTDAEVAAWGERPWEMRSGVQSHYSASGPSGRSVVIQELPERRSRHHAIYRPYRGGRSTEDGVMRGPGPVAEVLDAMSRSAPGAERIKVGDQHLNVVRLGDGDSRLVSDNEADALRDSLLALRPLPQPELVWTDTPPECDCWWYTGWLGHVLTLEWVHEGAWRAAQPRIGKIIGWEHFRPGDFRAEDRFAAIPGGIPKKHIHDWRTPLPTPEWDVAAALCGYAASNKNLAEPHLATCKRCLSAHARTEAAEQALADLVLPEENTDDRS